MVKQIFQFVRNFEKVVAVIYNEPLLYERRQPIHYGHHLGCQHGNAAQDVVADDIAETFRE